MKTIGQSRLGLVVLGLLTLASVSQAQHPNYPILMFVPWIKQPGDNLNTKNCGQTCTMMAYRYFYGGTLSVSDVVSANTWLRVRFSDPRYTQDANGWYTTFYVSGQRNPNSLGVLLTDLTGLRYGLGIGRDTTDITRQLAQGCPVIAGVRISGGKLGTSGVDHWCMVVGWDPQKRELILNDPGTVTGHFKHISLTDFDATWATSGRIYAAVWR